MPDLSVDLGLLQSSAQTLQALIDEFGGAEDTSDEFHEDIGASAMQSAVSSFATNWKSHRESLTQSMTSVHSMASKSHDTYVNVDQQLTSDLASSMDRPTQQVRLPGGAR